MKVFAVSQSVALSKGNKKQPTSTSKGHELTRYISFET